MLVRIHFIEDQRMTLDFAFKSSCIGYSIKVTNSNRQSVFIDYVTRKLANNDKSKVNIMQMSFQFPWELACLNASNSTPLAV